MIKIYTVPDCKHCNRAKEILTERGISYEEFNLKEKNNRDARAYYRKLGVRTAPVIVDEENDWILTDFDEESLIMMLEDYHDRK